MTMKGDTYSSVSTCQLPQVVETQKARIIYIWRSFLYFLPSSVLCSNPDTLIRWSLRPFSYDPAWPYSLLWT